MTIDTIVTDPGLRAFLETSQHARQQALSLAHRLEAAYCRPSSDGAAVTTEEQVALSKDQKLLNTNLSHLRGLHRAAYMGARDTKALTAEARQEVDVLHLQLQNLYYEQAHLQGEIAACESHEYVSSLGWRLSCLCVASSDPIIITIATSTKSYRSSPSTSSSPNTPSTTKPTRMRSWSRASRTSAASARRWSSSARSC